MSLIWTQATLEPKRKFRYVVSFAENDNLLSDFTFLAQTCDRPGMKIGSAEHKYFDKTYYHPGKVTWEPNPLSIKLVDIQKGGGSSTDTNGNLMQAFVRSGLSGLINSDGTVKTIGKAAATNALGKVTIRVLNSALDELPGAAAGAGGAGPGGIDAATSELWTLNNAWLDSIKPDALDYGSEDILTTTITLRYDWAELKVHGETGNQNDAINKFGK